METRKIGSLTEIYVNGEGKYITESQPTNFHHFYTSKILTAQETESMYREVTSAERTALEKSDAAWEEPSADLLSWAQSVDVPYNAATGFFELNGLNLSADDLRHIRNNYGLMFTIGNLPDRNARTNMPQSAWSTQSPGTSNPNLHLKFYSMPNLEVVVLDNTAVMPTNLSRTFANCPKLREIKTPIRLTRYESIFMAEQIYNTFSGCKSLETLFLEIEAPITSLNLSECPKLSLESVAYLIQHVTYGSKLTITWHPDIYAKLSDTTQQQIAAGNIAQNSNVPVNSTAYLMQSYRLSSAPVTGDAVTATVWGSVPEGQSFYCLMQSTNGCKIEGRMSEVSPGVWQLTKTTYSAAAATFDVIHIYNYPSKDNSIEAHIDKVKLCYGPDSNPEWTETVEEPSDASIAQSVAWRRAALSSAAKQITFATTE